MSRAHAARVALVCIALAGPACDRGLAPVGCAGICGTVTIRGTAPDSTDSVFVLAYASFPQTCDEISSFLPFPPPQIPLRDTIASYALSLADGRYEWIVAAWKKVGTLTLTPADTALLREAGFYRDPLDSARAGVVTVSTGVHSIDFVVDLDQLHPITDYVTCAGG